MGISYNRIILVGRFTKDPESHYSASGVHVVKFALAVDRPQTAAQSEAITDFINITAFGKTGDFVKSYLSKGRLALVEGRLQISRVQGQDGTTKYFTDVVADNVRFMETKASATSGSKEPYRSSKSEDAADSKELYTEIKEPPVGTKENPAAAVEHVEFFESDLSKTESSDDEIPF